MVAHRALPRELGFVRMRRSVDSRTMRYIEFQEANRISRRSARLVSLNTLAGVCVILGALIDLVHLRAERGAVPTPDQLFVPGVVIIATLFWMVALPFFCNVADAPAGHSNRLDGGDARERDGESVGARIGRLSAARLVFQDRVWRHPWDNLVVWKDRPPRRLVRGGA